MPSLADTLKKAAPKVKHDFPLWKGPNDPSPLGGITQSMLSGFLVCRERFRLKYVEGLRPPESFNHKMEYGNMWHVCEEALARGVSPDNKLDQWIPLVEYVRELCRRYPTQQTQIDHWYRVCKTQFPYYVDYWKKHPDVKQRIPLLQEEVFDVSYQLPSGRSVRLRGKFDSVDWIGPKTTGRVFLQENKAKGEIKEQQLREQLQCDLQTMMYLIALRSMLEKGVIEGLPFKSKRPTDLLAGVRYNVIRRPLSGGKGSIKQHQPSKSNPQGESKDAFYKRLADDYIAVEPETFFMRWQCIVTPTEIARFERRVLQPILENLCDWWEYMKVVKFTPWEPGMFNNVVIKQAKGLPDIHYRYNSIHWQHPYGIYNVINEGGKTDVDEYLINGSTVGLERATTLFPELQ